MIANLSDILAKATVSSELVKRPVVWEKTDSEGNKTEEKFDVFVVSDASFAAVERIYLGDSENSGQMGRTICEYIRFGEDGSQKMTTEQASNLDPTLGMAFMTTLRKFREEKEAAKVKK